jgi:predicted nucleotidyltransferase component of viral defense system
LVFKGGTALQKAYALNRFSIDLDFTLNDVNFDSQTLFKKIVSDLNSFGLKTETIKLKKKVSEIFILKIQGPLYDGIERSLSSLRIEISLREKIILGFDVKEIVPIYPDIQPYIIVVMKLEEILAEKIRAILTRAKARDVYDAWFLIKKGVKTEKKIINEKLSYYSLKFNKDKFISNVKRIEKTWKKELEPLVSFIPDFNTVFKNIKDKF